MILRFLKIFDACAFNYIVSDHIKCSTCIAIDPRSLLFWYAEQENYNSVVLDASDTINYDSCYQQSMWASCKADYPYFNKEIQISNVIGYFILPQSKGTFIIAMRVLITAMIVMSAKLLYDVMDIIQRNSHISYRQQGKRVQILQTTR
jgi:hypothetical protein